MDRPQRLSDDTLRAIDLIAAAMSAAIIEQLRQASQMISQTDKPMAAKERDLHIDKLLENVLSRSPIHELGVRKTIVLNIGSFIKPGSQDDTMTFLPSNKTFIPTRIIQQPDLATGKEASKEFADKLSKVVQSKVVDNVKHSGTNVCDTFFREQKLHRKRHQMEAHEHVCIFKLMEEDYEVPDHTGRIEVVGFGFKCETCGGRHELRVFR